MGPVLPPTRDDAAASVWQGRAKGGHFGAAYVGLAGLAALLPWLPRWVPTQDGPQQVRLTAFLIEMRTDPASPLHAVYHDSLGLVTGSLFSWFCYLLHPVLTLDAAERLWLSLCMVGFAWVGWLVTRAAHPTQPARVLLLAPFLVHGFVTFGFYPYLASVPLAAGGALLVARPPVSGSAAWRTLMASGLLVLCCLAHVSSLALAFGLVVLLVLGQPRWGAGFLRAALAFAPAFFLLVGSSRVLDLSASAHQTPISDVIEMLSPLEAMGQFFSCALAGVGHVDRVVQTLCLLLAFGLVAMAIAQAIERTGVRTLTLRLPAPAWPVLLLVLLGLGLTLLPSRYKGWAYASARVIPFILLLLPAAAFWPRSGSVAERRLSAGLVAGSLMVRLAIGQGWFEIGMHLQSVASAGTIMRPGTRMLPLVFAPGPEAKAAVRAAGRSLHAWAIPSRLRHAMVPFGFENMRRLMLIARPDARPPFPAGPDEFAAAVLWNKEPQKARVFADYGFYAKDITDTARFLAPAVTRPDFYAALRDAVLRQAEAGFHYLLAVDPPPRFLAQVTARGWPCLYADGGVYVYRLGLGFDTFVLSAAIDAPR